MPLRPVTLAPIEHDLLAFCPLFRTKMRLQQVQSVLDDEPAMRATEQGRSWMRWTNTSSPSARTFWASMTMRLRPLPCA